MLDATPVGHRRLRSTCGASRGSPRRPFTHMRSYEEVIDGAVPLVRGSGLAKCANFAVLAGSTVTNTGATRVTGDLGVSASSPATRLLANEDLVNSVAAATNREGGRRYARPGDDLGGGSDTRHRGRWPAGGERGGAGDARLSGDGAGRPAVHHRGRDRRRDDAARRLLDRRHV